MTDTTLPLLAATSTGVSTNTLFLVRLSGETADKSALGSDLVDLMSAQLAFVPTSRTVNGSPLSSNVTISTITGNAGTATALQTPRAINGTNFDGSAAITVTAAAGTLTGTTLNSTVVTSSLTGVGTITTGAWQGTAVADTYIASASTWNAKAGSGANTDITSILLNQTGLAVKGATSFALTIKPNETMTAARTLNIVTGDATRTLTFTADATIGGTSSGTNTGDQTITLTSDVTGSGTGSFVTSIAASAVTLAKMADMATASLFYRKTAGAGAPEVQTLATLKTDLGLTGTNSGDQTITLTSDVTGSGTGSFATTIAANAVTNAKMAQMAAHTYKGNNTGSTANAADLTATQLTAELNVFAASLKGLVPAAAASPDSAKFLAENGVFVTPSVLPQNSQSTAYTTVLTDAGKHILHPSADTTARIFTIDSNANVAYPIGTALTFVNQHSAGIVTIAITTDTMRLAGAGTTGSRTLAADGVATALKLTSTEWIISGTGLT